MGWWQTFRDRLASLRGRPALDTLLAQARPDHPLAERVAWAEDLFAWMRRDAPATRLRLLLQVLERQPEARQRVAQTFRSIVRDTEALDLFADTGLPGGMGFTREFLSRLVSDVLPNPPETRDLADIFDRLFPRGRVADWLEQLDAEHAAQILDLFQHGELPEEGGWVSLRTDLEDAMVQLADRICVVGSSREVRVRLGKASFRELPFQKLTPAVEALLARRQAGTPLSELAAELNVVRGVADACDRAMEEVIGCLEKTGVSTALVYDIERLRAQVRRLELLLEAWSAPALEPQRKLAILADLVRQNHARRSVRELCRQNLHLLTRRIVERNAETGEHYVARNGREYAGMLRSAAGGGAILGITTFVKLLLAKLVLAEFFRGAFFGLNYAVSFVVVQLLGFSVATKQPATTASTLARRMGELKTASQLEALVDEVVFLLRSQIASVFGNLALVIPATLLLDVLWRGITGGHIVDEHKAEYLLGTVAPFSGCWVFAIFTGVLLWLSSLFAAWADNWFVLHQLGSALAQHRGGHRWLGPTRTRRLAVWLEHNIAGLAGNISLGLMLGIIPSVAVFFGLPLDVRHVTLSTGQVTAAFAMLGGEHLWRLSTVWIVLGILGTGLLNILVSFSLALRVAMRARNVRGPELQRFRRTLLKRLLKSPLSFVLPVGVVQSPNTSPH
ncbi:MAG TPA: recombinase [Verrucomicrobiae bacterium]|nr:recombinase [Verrucomicrobiae bacterium]